MTMTDAFCRLMGTGQSPTDITPPVVSTNWFDLGLDTKRQFGGGQLVVARFACTASLTSGDPDNTVDLQIVLSPIALATPTTARTLAAFDGATGVDDVTDTITVPNHGLINGIRVVSDVTLAGITAATNYYIRDATTNTFRLAATPGGAAINLTDAAGAITLTWHPVPVAASGPIGFDAIIADKTVIELAINPVYLTLDAAVPRYLFAWVGGVSDLTGGTLTCDLCGGYAMDGKPLNKVNYVTM